MSETRVAVLVGSLRADSVNRKLAELLRDQAPEGVTLDIVDGLDQLPFYNEDIDGEPTSPPPPRPSARARRSRRPRPRRDPRVQRHHAGRPQQRHRLAVAALRRRARSRGKPFGVVGTTPTPYGGKWSHADALRSATHRRSGRGRGRDRLAVVHRRRRAHRPRGARQAARRRRPGSSTSSRRRWPPDGRSPGR